MRLPIPIRKFKLSLLEIHSRILPYQKFALASISCMSVGFVAYFVLSQFSHTIDCLDGVDAYIYTRVADGVKVVLQKSCK